MSPARLWTVARLDLLHSLRRPVLYVLVFIIGFFAYFIAGGEVQIGTGDSTVGAAKAFVNSEFANAQVISVFLLTVFGFFFAVIAGTLVIRDDEQRVGQILHSTRLTAGEYIWGRFLATLAVFTAMLVVFYLLIEMFSIPGRIAGGERGEIVGPFDPVAWLRPMLVLGMPLVIFVAGVSFMIGERSRRAIPVFFLPVAMLLICGFFLWEFSPAWLDPRINSVLMWIDPGGYRWLNETWLTVDRGVDFYNTAAVPYDIPFLLSRLAWVGVGLGAVAWSHLRFERSLRGVGGHTRRRRRQVEEPAAPATATPAPLRSLAMTSRRPGLLRAALDTAAVEARELRASAGLYLFVPLIVLQILGPVFFATGPFDTPVLHTAGNLAVSMANTITLLVCLLLLFYTVESMQRERNTNLSPIHDATPARTASMLLGKALANSLVGVVVLVISFVGSALILLAQGKTGVQLGPFVLVWGVLLLPTFLVWTAFVAFLQSLTGNRYGSYAIALAALGLSGWLQLTGRMHWVGNWNLWSALVWSDMGVFEIDRRALVLNRLFALAMAALFLGLAVRLHRRRAIDAAGFVNRLRPGPLFRVALRTLPLLVAPAVLGAMLWVSVASGFQSEANEKRQKDYWRRNILTYKDAPTPTIAHIDAAVTIDPAARSMQVDGEYTLVNRTDEPLREILLTPGLHYRDTTWRRNGQPYEVPPADNRAGLIVMRPEQPLAPGDEMRVGFAFGGVFPEGVTKNGGGSGQFILPSGVVLPNFGPAFLPAVGYIDTVGVDEDNRADSRDYPDDFYEGVTEPLFGPSTPLTARIAVTGPADYRFNSVGVLTSDTVEGDLRTMVWETDTPVRILNIVGGRWAVAEGEGVAIYHHPEHDYNIDEMVRAFEAARRWYSEWFYPYPWQELKLSEFPNLATYAQGFATNITFSEGIGFLTRSDAESNIAFMVTAHEAAHQWWGNILTPGRGPGGNILSEGTAHFSTILLHEQVLGDAARIGFMKKIENQYGEGRRADAERPLVKIDGSRPGDGTVTYDKGGWVFWMLMHHIGRERALEGMREFITIYKDGPDHPVLQDFVRVMRPSAPDAEAYDAFTRQWFFDVVVPEYRLENAARAERDGAWETTLTIRNAGTGVATVEVAACAGERFDAKSGDPLPDYRDARESVTLGAGESREVTIRSEFQPDRVLVDPDAMVLMLKRESAIVRF